MALFSVEFQFNRMVWSVRRLGRVDIGAIEFMWGSRRERKRLSMMLDILIRFEAEVGRIRGFLRIVTLNIMEKTPCEKDRAAKTGL